MSAKKNNNNTALKALEDKLKKVQTLNYILIALCAVLLVVCIILAASSCGTDTDLPNESASALPSADGQPTGLTGTYQYISPDDSYGFAIEITEDGAVWFYEATKDESLVQGFVGELLKASEVSGSDSNVGYYIPLAMVNFTPYRTAHVDLSLTEDGNLLLTQFEDAVLTERAPAGEILTLTAVENYSLSQTIVALYADEMAS